MVVLTLFMFRLLHIWKEALSREEGYSDSSTSDRAERLVGTFEPMQAGCD
jgi:hypothetical protein